MQLADPTPLLDTLEVPTTLKIHLPLPVPNLPLLAVDAVVQEVPVEALEVLKILIVTPATIDSMVRKRKLLELDLGVTQLFQSSRLLKVVMSLHLPQSMPSLLNLLSQRLSTRLSSNTWPRRMPPRRLVVLLLVRPMKELTSLNGRIPSSLPRKRRIS